MDFADANQPILWFKKINKKNCGTFVASREAMQQKNKNKHTDKYI